MLLVGRNGGRFELTVAGYEFPNERRDEYQGNWLNITIDVVTERGSWNSTDPCLLTKEVARLAAWLEGVAQSRPQPADIDFTEPNLEFELYRASGDDVTLRVWFDHESRPSWAPAHAADECDLWVDLEVARQHVHSAAQDLQEQLNRFPMRAIPR